MITFDLKPKAVEKKLEMSLDDLIKIGGKKSAKSPAGKALSKAKAGATGIAAKKQAIKGRRSTASGSKQAPISVAKKIKKGGKAPKTLAAKGRVIKVGASKVGSVMAKKILNKARANKQGQNSAPKILPAANNKKKGAAPKTLLVKKAGPKLVIAQKKGQKQNQNQGKGFKARGGGSNVNDGYKNYQGQQQRGGGGGRGLGRVVSRGGGGGGGRGLGRVSRGGVRKQRAPIHMSQLGMMGMGGMPFPQAAFLGLGLGGGGGGGGRGMQAPYSTALQGPADPQLAYAQIQMQQASMAKYQKQVEHWGKQMINFQKQVEGGARGGARGGGGGGGRGQRGRGARR